jgi:hypothetical protein
MGIRWKENIIVNVKLKENLFTLAQLYQDPHVQFFKISNNTGKWGKIDLAKTEKYLFTYSERSFYKERFIGRLNHITPIDLKPPKYAISSSLLWGNCLVEPIFKGKQKIYETYNAKVIKKDLDAFQDEDIIRQYELTGMEENLNLTSRLIYFYETGLDIDLYKLALFYPDEHVKYLRIFEEKFLSE